MPSKYFAAYNQAIINYMTSVERPGYPKQKSILERFTGCKQTIPEEAAVIIDLLRHATTESISKQAIEQFLAKDYSSPHSVSAYIVDALSEAYPDEKWTRFRTKSEAIATYRGTIFRGDSRPPDMVFTTGFDLMTPLKAMAAASKYVTGSHGISCTKSFDVAKRYADEAKQSSSSPTFIYVIDYQGNAGIDILATNMLQAGPKRKYLTKAEVNVVEPIPPQSIVGAIEIKGSLNELHPNPVYTGDISLADVAAGTSATRSRAHLDRELTLSMRDCAFRRVEDVTDPESKTSTVDFDGGGGGGGGGHSDRSYPTPRR